MRSAPPLKLGKVGRQVETLLFGWFRRKTLSPALLESAEAVAASFRSGVYSDLRDRSSQETRAFLAERLREREPGHSLRDYRDAIAAGLHATR